MKSSKTGKGDL